MSEQVIIDTAKRKLGISVSTKRSDGNYGSDEVMVYIEADVDFEASDQDKLTALKDAAFVARACIYEQLGVAMENKDGVLSEAVKAVTRAFPGTTDVSSSYTAQDMASTQPGLRVKGQQHGELPSWLLEAAAKDGVSEVYDNRDGLAENPKRPWFKATTGGKDAKGFWPPKAR